MNTIFKSAFILLASVPLLCTAVLRAQPTLKTTVINDNQANIVVTIPVKKGHYLHADSVQFSIDSPNVTLSSNWQPSIRAISYYDESFKETKKAFDDIFNVTLQINGDNLASVDDVNLHVSYYSTDTHSFTNEVLPIALHAPEHMQSSIAVDDAVVEAEVQNAQSEAQPCVPAVCKKTPTWSDKISSLIKTTDSLWIQILLVLILGILMSLTPCIYPMIPITIGILQSQGSKKSFTRNFLLSLSYTFGIASTFALLGLLAAFSGQVFGSLLMNPIIILLLVALLAYLGLSMLGFYDMYVPRAFRQSGAQKGGGSIASAFLFGIASGTVASPCLSPGLILLLSIVTTLGSKLLGFILLFAFGVGLSLPLLLIGSFSGSINVLPQAGMWMVEVKRIFGLMLFGMCFYFLNNIIPYHYLLWVMSVTCLIAGLFYLYIIKKNDTAVWRCVKSAIGMALIAFAVVLCAKAYQETYKQKSVSQTCWNTEYDLALAQAKRENKKLFIDVGAPCCSICHAIDDKLFRDKKTFQVLNASCVLLKIDGSESNPSTCAINEKYGVKGFPTIILVNPHNEAIIKKWGPELYETPNEEFIKQIEELTIN